MPDAAAAEVTARVVVRGTLRLARLAAQQRPKATLSAHKTIDRAQRAASLNIAAGQHGIVGELPAAVHIALEARGEAGAVLQERGTVEEGVRRRRSGEVKEVGARLHDLKQAVALQSKLGVHQQ